MNDSSYPFPRILLLTCVAALGGFLFGYDSGVINGTVSALQQAFGASDVASGFNVASMLLGCAAGLSQWLSNFIVTITFPALLTSIGLGGAYGIYASFAVLAALYAWKFVPETKGKTLEEM